jgi:hypothetical protein
MNNNSSPVPEEKKASVDKTAEEGSVPAKERIRLKCTKCGHENEKDALYCSQCGKSLVGKKTDWPNVLLLAYCGSLLFFAIVTAVLGYLSTSTDVDWHLITYFAAFFGIAQALTTFIVPMGMTKLSLKSTAFVLVILAIILTICALVQTIIHTANLEY